MGFATGVPSGGSGHVPGAGPAPAADAADAPRPHQRLDGHGTPRRRLHRRRPTGLEPRPPGHLPGPLPTLLRQS